MDQHKSENKNGHQSQANRRPDEQIQISSQGNEDSPHPSIIFKKGVTKGVIQRVLSQPLLKKIMNSELWPLEHGNYDRIGGRQLFQLFEELKIQRIWLFKNQKPNILKEITHIKFDHLAKLMINYNSICSIEQICFMDLPSLEGIGLIGNHILSIKPFRKCNFPLINFFGIEKNVVKDFQYLQQISFDRGYSILLERDVYFLEYDSVQGEDVNWMFKLESRYCQDFWIRSKKRILKQKLLEKAFNYFDACTIGTKYG